MPVLRRLLAGLPADLAAHGAGCAAHRRAASMLEQTLQASHRLPVGFLRNGVQLQGGHSASWKSLTRSERWEDAQALTHAAEMRLLSARTWALKTSNSWTAGARAVFASGRLGEGARAALHWQERGREPSGLTMQEHRTEAAYGADRRGSSTRRAWR
jgi:hypothetical protein